MLVYVYRKGPASKLPLSLIEVHPLRDSSYPYTLRMLCSGVLKM